MTAKVQIGDQVVIISDEDAQLPTAAEQLAEERESMVVSRFQARRALKEAGLFAAAEAAVAAATEEAQDAWADAVEFQRNSPTIAALAAGLGLTDTDLDNLFRAAALIEA